MRGDLSPVELGERLVGFTVATLEALERHHLPGWRIPRTFAGHEVGADVRADLIFTLGHLAEAGVAEVGGRRIDELTTQLLADVRGAFTNTFFSYRIAETLLRHGPFAGNPLLAPLTDAQRAEVERATDSSDWHDLLDAGVLPRNYAAVLSRVELARVELGLVEDRAVLDSLVARARAVLEENPRRALDDSNDRVGRYDIYTADVWLFCETLAPLLGPVWEEGLRAALDLVLAVGARDGTAVAWGRSTGALGAALTLELASLALAEGFAAERAPVWLRRALDATASVERAFDPDGVVDAHRHKNQDGYRGPARRLQLTFDLLGKVAWAAGALQRVDPALRPATVVDAYPPQDRWIAFEDARPAGVWAHRGRAVDLVLPFVGITRSHYLPAPVQPGTWEVPVDRDLPTWTPLVVDRLDRFTAGGLPTSIEHGDGALVARWDGFERSGRGLDGDEVRPPVAGSRTARFSVEGRSIVLDDELTFDEPPAAVSLAIPEVPGRPLRVDWASEDEHATTTVTVDGLTEWRSPWSELARVHQIDLAPARHLRYRAWVTPLLQVSSTAYGHHYHESLYEPMADRVVARPPVVGWEADADPDWAHVDLLHLHWPEWLAFDDLAAHEAIIEELAGRGIPVAWTAHNLTPHDKRPEVYEPIYAAWAAAADAVIHHSAWGEEKIRARYAFKDGARHEVIPHGHFGGLWSGAGLPPRAEAERRLGLGTTGLRIGIVGAPRREKLVQAVLDGVAACGRDDVELVCWSLGPDDVVPDDPRIPIAHPYKQVSREAYATRLAACDALALVFDEDGEMLATGAAADAVGLGLPALRSDWGYLVETLGAAGLPCGQTPDSIAAALDGLSAEALDAAREGAHQRRAALDWSLLATRTHELFERTVVGG